MLIIILLAVCVLVVTYLAMRGNKSSAAQLIQPRPGPLTLGIQIICGDCCGEEERPRKTFLDRFGNCAQCGGHSYILAAQRIVYAQQLMAARLADYKAIPGNSRIA